MAWNVINTVIAVLALIVGGVAAYYARKQVLLIRAERQRQNLQQQDNVDWSARADEVIKRLVTLVPRWSNGNDGVPGGPLYPMVLNDPDLRTSVETYLITRNGERATPRMMTHEILQIQIVRETIRRVEEQFTAVRQNSPALAAKASLLR